MSAQSSNHETFLQKLTRVIDDHLSDENFGVNELAAELGMSRSTLHRKVKQVIKKSVSTFIRETRLKRSYKMLEDKSGSVAEIAYLVGFGSATYFSKCFHEYYGFLPGDVLKGNHAGVQPVAKKEIKLSKGAIYAGVTGVVSVLVLLVIYLSFFTNRSENQKTSIAILPPTEINPEDDLTGTLNTLRYYLHNSLGHIEELAVCSNLSTDKYQHSPKTLKQIATEVHTDFILSIKASTSRNRLEIITMLDDSKTGSQMSTESYQLKPDGENLNEISKQIVLHTARDLKISLTKEELEKINKKLTNNEAALRHYNAGIGLAEYARQELYSPVWKKASEEFRMAVELDTAFAEAWLNLAKIYAYQEMLPKLGMSPFVDLKRFQLMHDSIREMINHAKSNGQSDEVLNMFVNSLYSCDQFEDSELAKNPMRTSDYYRAAAILAYIKEDYYNAIKNQIRFHESIQNLELAETTDLSGFVIVTTLSGFPEVAERLAKSMLEKTRDTLIYRYVMVAVNAARQVGVLDYLKQCYQRDTTDIVFVNLLQNINMRTGNYDEAYKFLRKRVDLYKIQNRKQEPNPFMAYLYAVYGDEKEKNWHCQKLLENRIALNDSFPTPTKSGICIQLAIVYSILEEKDSALMCIEKIAEMETMPLNAILYLQFIKNFESLKNDPQFQLYFREIRARFDIEREKIKQLLIEEGLKEADRKDQSTG